MKDFSKKQNIAIIFQTIITLFLLASVVLSNLTEGFQSLVKVFVGMTFIGLSINNKLIFKRKYFTALYFLAAIVAFWSII